MTNTPTRLLAGALALLPAVLTAQTPSAEAKKKPAETAPAETLELEKLEVTGSRIRTLVGEQTAIPVISLNQLELEQRGVSRLADIRWAIPQLGPSVGFNDNMLNSGTSRAQTVSTSFALRGISGNSTLILIDGRRVPHSGQEAPGGAGGREDFNFDGIPVSAIERIEILPQGAGAIYGSDAITGVVNIILKKNFKGNEVSYTYDNAFDTDVAQQTINLTGGYRAGKLSTFYTFSQTTQNALLGQDRWWTASNDLTPYGASYNSNIYSPYAGAGTLASGYYPKSSATVYTIPAGSKGAFTTGQAITGTNGAALYDSAGLSERIPESRSRSAVIKADYDFAPWLRPYLQARFNTSRTYTHGTYNTLTTQLAAGKGGNPFASAMYLSKVFYDLPTPYTVSEQENTGLVLGVDGDLPGDWRYDVSGSFARNVVSDDSKDNGFDFTKLSAAIANGAILTYDSTTAGTDPNATGLIRGLLNNSSHKDTTDVYQYSAQANGTVWSGWAGDIRAAAGGETQSEKVRFSRTPAISYVLSAPFKRDVSAAFAELSVPLLSERQGVPFIHRAEVGGAVRAEHFSDLGAHTSPAYNGLIQPVKWLTIRGSRSEGFKAPKLYDLLAPNYTTTTTVTASRGIKDTQRNNEAVVGTYALTTGGQPNLKPETSVTKNFGIVLDVPFFKGLSLSADRWEIDYNDQVSSPGLQDLITFFPSRVTRDASGVITGFDNSVINQAKVSTKGVDYSVTFQRTFSVGTFSFSSSYSEPSDLVAIATPSSKPTYRKMPLKGTTSLFWNKGAWTAGTSVNYQGEFQSYAGDTARYPSYIEWNPQVAYDFGRSTLGRDGGITAAILRESKVSLTIVNVFNNEPDDWAVGKGRVIADPRLRRYIITVSKKF